MTVVEDQSATPSAVDTWLWIHSLIRDVNSDRSAENVARRFYEWDFSVRQFRKVEFNTFLGGRPSPAVLHQHKESLEELIANGRQIEEDLDKYGSRELTTLKITPECICAYISSLEESWAEWHHSRNV